MPIEIVLISVPIADLYKKYQWMILFDLFGQFFYEIEVLIQIPYLYVAQLNQPLRGEIWYKDLRDLSS